MISMAQTLTLSSLGYQHNLDSSTSKPLIGNDIRRRMIQLEMKSRVPPALAQSHDAPASRKGIDIRARSTSFNNPLANTTTKVCTSDQSLTTSELKVDTSPTHKSSISNNNPPPLSPTPICDSPTWETGKVREHKRYRSEESNGRIAPEENDGQRTPLEQSPGKARKRLSKRPPAAMETQGYTFTPSSPSRADSRDSSSRASSLTETRDVRRSSISSFSSTLKFPDLLYKRASSTPSLALDSATVPAVQQATDSHRPRKESRVSFVTKVSSEDDAYVADLVDFACEMGRSAQKALEDDVRRAKIDQQRRSAALSTHSVESAVLMKAEKAVRPSFKVTLVKQERKQSENSMSQRRAVGKRDNSIGGYKYPNFKKLLRKEGAKSRELAALVSHTKSAKTWNDPRSHTWPPDLVFHNIPKSEGYVQKHRYFLQQRSIARYKDEIAIKSATEALFIAQAGEVQELSKQGLHATQVGVSSLDSLEVVTTNLSKRQAPKIEAKEEPEKTKVVDQVSVGLGRQKAQRTLAEAIFAIPEWSVEKEDIKDRPPPSKTREKSSPRATLPTRLVPALLGKVSPGAGYMSSERAFSMLDGSSGKVEQNVKDSGGAPNLGVRKKTSILSLLHSSERAEATRMSFGSPGQPISGHSQNRQSLGPIHSSGPGGRSKQNVGTQQLAKIFVICCSCQRWHDLPSRVYEAMIRSKAVEEPNLGGDDLRTKTNVPAKAKVPKVYEDIKCTWCEHRMSTSCCAAWTTVMQMCKKYP